MRWPLRSSIAVLVSSAALVAQGFAPAQQDPPTVPQVFRADTLLVPLNVRVVDRNGRPVTDLKASDFTILEDHVPQQVTTFATQAFTPDATLASLGPKRASSVFETTTTNQRTFLIVLGRGRLQAPAYGVDAMFHFVRERLLPQDLVALVAFNHATDFTTDHARIVTLLERFKRSHEGIELLVKHWSRGLAGNYGGRLPAGIQREMAAVFGGPQAEYVRTFALSTASAGLRGWAEPIAGALPGEGQESLGLGDPWIAGMPGEGDDDRYPSDQDTMLMDCAKLALGVEYLRPLAGEKHLIFVSEYGSIPMRRKNEDDVARLASDARVILHFIYTGGVNLNLLANAGARELAQATGGRFFANRYPNAAMDVDLIEESGRFEYMLGYTPSPLRLDGGYRRVTVTVNRPGLTVLARDGYYATTERPAFDRKSIIVNARVSMAASAPGVIPDIAIREASATNRLDGTARTIDARFTIDLSRVALARQGGLNVGSLEVAVFAVTSRQQTVGSAWKTVDLSFSDAQLEDARRAGLPYAVAVPADAKVDALKVVAYNYDADLLGAAVVKVK